MFLRSPERTLEILGRKSELCGFHCIAHRSSLFSPFLEDEQTGPRRPDIKTKRETHAFNMDTSEVNKINLDHSCCTT